MKEGISCYSFEIDGVPFPKRRDRRPVGFDSVRGSVVGSQLLRGGMILCSIEMLCPKNKISDRLVAKASAFRFYASIAGLREEGFCQSSRWNDVDVFDVVKRTGRASSHWNNGSQHLPVSSHQDALTFFRLRLQVSQPLETP